MQKRKKIIAGILLIILLLFSAVVVTFIILGRSYLVVEPDAKPSEAIYVLAGGDERLERGLELYEEQYANRLILSDGEADPELEAKALEAGVHPSSIVNGRHVESTWEEAKVAEALVEEEGIDTLIVVTSDFHTRRVKMTFDKILEEEGTEISYAVADTSFDPDSKLTEKQHLTAFREYVKIFFYKIRLLFQ